MLLWREVLRKNFTDWKKLFLFLELEERHVEEILPKSPFPLNLPYRLAEKIEKNNVQDPILRQFLPLKQEAEENPLFTVDPVGDLAARKAPKLLHKYKGRALLTVSSSCAMHCRFCFRRNFPYEKEEKGFEEELQLIREDSSLKEIILSGGDPLSLGNVGLGKLIADLNSIPHLKRIRFHTRFPLGIPERIDAEFLKILEGSTQQIVFILHSNHSRELDEQVLKALKTIQRLGIPVLNQAVLLKGVNDSESVLKELCETLADHGILPYYLHQLDQVKGGAHFEVEQERGKALLEKLAQELSGYALPRYVKEVAGEPHKMDITSFPEL